MSIVRRSGCTLAVLVALAAAARAGDDASRLDNLDRAAALLHQSDRLGREGKSRDALAKAEEALALQRKALLETHPAVRRTALYVARLLLFVREPARARDLLTATLPAVEKALGAEHLQFAYFHEELGRAHGQLGQFAQARRCHEKALPVFRKKLPDAHPAIADCLNHLGFTCYDQHDWLPCQRALEEAVARMRKRKPIPAVALRIALTNLGAAERELGQSASSKRRFEDALALYSAEQRFEPDRANALLGLGNVLLDLGQPADALPHIRESLAVRRKVLAANHLETASSLNSLGVAHDLLGRHAEARKLFSEALPMFRKVLPADHPEIAVCLSNVAKLDLLARDHKRALGGFEEALAMRRRTQPPGHPDLAVALNNVAGGLLIAGRDDDAWERLRSASEILVSFRLRVLPGVPQQHHAPFLLAHRYALDNVLRMAELLPRRTAEQSRELFHLVQQYKAVSGTALRARQEALALSREPAVRADYEQLREARQRLADRMLNPAGAAPAAVRAACAELQQRIDDLERKLADRVGAFADLMTLEKNLGTRTLSALDVGTVLVELVAYEGLEVKEEVRRPRCCAALLAWRDAKGAAEVRFVPLGPSEPIARALTAWRRTVQKGGTDAAQERELRQRAWEPIARQLPKQTERLVIAPDGELALLPFEALRLDDGKYLVERWPVRYVSSGRDLARPGEKSTADRVAVVLSDPAFDAVGGKAQGAPEARGAPPAGLRSGLRFGSLPGFATEAESVAKLLGKSAGWSVRQLSGEGAEEAALAKAVRPRLLYCITHGFFLEDVAARPGMGLRELELISSSGAMQAAKVSDPRVRSGLALAGANKWQERSSKGQSDGFLTALEVENLDLWGTELVVLSACETGLGEVLMGEGVVGLRNAFQQAGARTVLASLWKVPDAETEQLMTDTLSRWLKGSAPHEALRGAQLEMIERLRQRADRREAPPLYWAGFVCHGPR